MSDKSFGIDLEDGRTVRIGCAGCGARAITRGKAVTVEEFGELIAMRPIEVEELLDEIVSGDYRLPLSVVLHHDDYEMLFARLSAIRPPTH